jgi:hypothetical protein
LIKTSWQGKSTQKEVHEAMEIFNFASTMSFNFLFWGEKFAESPERKMRRVLRTLKNQRKFLCYALMLAI